VKASAEMTGAESSLTCWQAIVHRFCSEARQIRHSKRRAAIGIRRHLIIDGKSAMFFSFANFFNSCLTSVRTRLTSQAVTATRLVPQ
jgi:hypothetical protein